MLERNKIILSGKVQGVFFRKFICENAVKLGLKGYVKNTADRNVEAVFEGEKEKIKSMIELCRKGPESAKVENIKIIKEKFQHEKGFRRLN